MTRTVGQGACADCWRVKTEAGRPVIRAGKSRTDPLLDLDLGWFELLPGWMWLALALALGCGVTILLTVILTVA